MKWIPLFLVLLLSACEQSAELPERSFANKVGTVFTSLPENILSSPEVEIIEFPEKGSVNAIWGATGRDDAGNIYFGTSSSDSGYGSAFLYQYNPEQDQLIQQSDTVQELIKNKVRREGVRQNKLHSKIYQADDGYLYFSSFDESGESEGVNPIWGGNLWRKLPDSKNWEHVLATKEALIAVNTNGKYVYALGYWNHVLYQYNTKTGDFNKVVAGSVKQHISRNFVVDELGHAYLPGLKMNDAEQVEVKLLEYDTDLKLVASYPLPSYKAENINHHHGIVGYTSMKNGDIYFTTSDGGLYSISPFLKQDKKVKYLGSMHPDGKAYISSLFTFDGVKMIFGVGRREEHEWIVYEIGTGLSYATELNVNYLNSPLLFGSSTKADNGDMFIAGWHRVDGDYKPILIRLKLK